MNGAISFAADPGVGSGRAIAGRFGGSRLRFGETNRFANGRTPPSGVFPAGFVPRIKP